MGSNLDSNNLPAHVSLSIEFGIRTPEGKIKENLKSYFLISKIITTKDIEEGFLFSPNKESTQYRLSLDVDTYEKIINSPNNSLACIVSFQAWQRDSEIDKIAVIREFSDKRASK